MRTARDRVWPLGGQPVSEPTFESGERESAGFGRRASSLQSQEEKAEAFVLLLSRV